MSNIALTLLFFLTVFSQSQGLWVTRFALLEENYPQQILSFVKANQISDVFIQLRGRGDAFYESNVEKNLKGIDHKKLTNFLNQLRAQNVKVHAWLNVFLLASSFEQLAEEPDHILNKNKNWIDYTEAFNSQSNFLKTDEDLKQHTDIEGLYTLPCFPDVLSYYQRIINEIVGTLPVDGIHFDYFRLADIDFGYHPKMRKLFTKETGLRIEQTLKNPGSNAHVVKSKWLEFVSQQFTDFLKGLTSLSSDVLWSVAVKPDPQDALYRKAQDWMTWLKKDIIDFAVPMNYLVSTKGFLKNMKTYQDPKFKERIWVGISTYNQSLNALREKMEMVRHYQMNYTLFSYNDLAEKKIIRIEK